jgi:cytochrome c-type biogenesis protein CcmH
MAKWQSMMRLFLLGLLLTLSLSASHANALTLDQPLASAPLEARAKSLFHSFRCMVCEGQSLADSDARHAADMRKTIRHMLKGGQSDEAVRQFLISRYGQAVLLRPSPQTLSNKLLWLAPIILCGIGLAIWGLSYRRKTTPPNAQNTSPKKADL